MTDFSGIIEKNHDFIFGLCWNVVREYKEITGKDYPGGANFLMLELSEALEDLLDEY